MNDLDLNKLEQIMKLEAERFTPEYFQQVSKNAYKEDRMYPENFSNWYFHILDFGKFSHADIISNQIFTLEESEKWKETDNINKVDWDSLNKILQPTLDKMEPHKLYNIKNGCFSNKFDFDTCITTKEELAKKLWKINCNSAMFDTGGYTELVVREMIPNHFEHPTIYNGMPLREELRVFYNMDKKKIEYIVDYWNYFYCYENLPNMTDKIVFNWFHNQYGNSPNNRRENHLNALSIMASQVQLDIDTLKFDGGLKGIWSIDFLLEDNKIYLIDMARGFRSAYWDVDNLTEGTKGETRQELEKIRHFGDTNHISNEYQFDNTGKVVKNIRTGDLGVVLKENIKTGQIQVRENIQPYVINTHDSWNTLEIVHT